MSQILTRMQEPDTNISPPAPRIYYLHPLSVGTAGDWPAYLRRVAALGFDTVLLAPVFAPAPGGSIFLTDDPGRLHPALGFDGDSSVGLAQMADLVRAAGMIPLLDVALDRVAAGGRLAQLAPLLYPQSNAGALDPRIYGMDADALNLAVVEPENFADWWAPHLVAVLRAGFAGFRLAALAPLGPANVRALITAVRRIVPACRFLGWTPGVPRQALSGYVGSGLDFVFSSLPWWNFIDEWLWQETAELRRIAPVIASPEAPFGPRMAPKSADLVARIAVCRRAIGFAAACFDGWMLPMGCEFAATARMNRRYTAIESPAGLMSGVDKILDRVIIAANQQRRNDGFDNTRLLTGPDATVSAIMRCDADPRFATQAQFVLLNNDLHHVREAPVPSVLSAAGGRFLPFRPDERLQLQPGEVAVFAAEASTPIRMTTGSLTDGAARAAGRPRLAIEAVTPVVDAGRFPVRRVAGEMVTVEADIICDGHDVLAVMLLWRERGITTWQEQKMLPLGNDRFRASFPLARIGLHEFSIEAWRDEFASFRDELGKKQGAGVAGALEHEEGRLLIQRSARTAPAAFRDALERLDQRLREAEDEARSTILLSEEVAALMARVDPRPFATRIDPPYAVEAERLAARFASWYEVFPRSLSDDETRHGTFDDVIRHLPRIRDLGFDVLYFPPIHPIGRRNRKGRNNSLTPTSDDPGSPYAIGADEGGHDALHPALGTLEDFRRLIARAGDAGLEIALDFAVQCAPDHPWLREHRDWFDWRPDGSIKYAENPPKKYQDIVNVDFYAPGAVPSLWQALCEVVLFWAAEGVRIFRVDNPHTKPLPFWQWLIAEVKARHPDAMFLAEAFTKPKMMYRLAKVGFTQSYSYFTWRNEKQELIDYLTELTTAPAAEFFRPNFFVNTPDINPIFLQKAGRPGFVIRATLAATLGGLWGVYNGFELCEAAALPGREEYLDAEKYQLRAWDWQKAGNITAEITALNRIRRANPALQTQLGLTFLPNPNPAMLCYEKALPDRSNVIIVAINLDPDNAQQTVFELPLWKWDLPDDGRLRALDLLRDTGSDWVGKYQTIRLDPPTNPVAIWRLAR